MGQSGVGAAIPKGRAPLLQDGFSRLVLGKLTVAVFVHSYSDSDLHCHLDTHPNPHPVVNTHTHPYTNAQPHPDADYAASLPRRLQQRRSCNH